MVIVSRTSVFPRPDQFDDIRDIIADFVKTNPNGIRISLWQAIQGEVPVLQVVSIFDTLGDYEKNRDANLKALNNVNSMVRQPNIVRLASSLVDPIGTLEPQHRYTQQVIVQPMNVGRDAVREAVREFSEGQQEDGRPLFRATEALLAYDGPAFSMMDSYQTLAELDNVRCQRAEKAAQFRLQVAARLRAPMMQRLREVIVPMN